MTTLDALRDIASIITCIVALFGIFPLIRNLTATEKNLRSKVFFDTLSLLDGKDYEIRKLRHILDDHIKTAAETGKVFDILSAKKEEQDELDKLARSYDQVGLLVKHGVVPTDFLFDFYSKPISKAWTYIRPLFNKRREKQPGHMLKFEILAIGAALYRQNKYQEKPDFLISEEDKAKWDKWNKWSIVPRHKKPYA